MYLIQRALWDLKHKKERITLLVVGSKLIVPNYGGFVVYYKSLFSFVLRATNFIEKESPSA